MFLVYLLHDRPVCERCQYTTLAGEGKNVGIAVRFVCFFFFLLKKKKKMCKDYVAPYRLPAGAVCVAGLAGRQRQVSSSAGIRQGAASGRQRGQRQRHALMVIVVMCRSVTAGSSLHTRASCLSLSSSSSSSIAHLQQTTCSVCIKTTVK